MSTTYNPLERAIARFLSKAPWLKSLSKQAYARLMYLRNRRPYDHKAVREVMRATKSDSETFFGYFDKSPQQGLFTLCHQVSVATNRKPQSEETIKIALLSEDSWSPLTRIPTTAFNWQQGARAHWLDNDHFIFNDFSREKQQYIARVFSASSVDEVKRFDRPVQDSFQTDYFLSLNYRRLLAMRPDYGYRNLPPLSGAELAETADDGIWRIDYQTGESRLLVSLDDMIAANKKPEFDGAVHKANHVMISPSGKQFIFLHRYYVGAQRFDRLMLADSRTGQLSVLSSYGMVSHCFWINDNKIIGYLRGPDGKDAYWIVDITDGSFTHFAKGALDHYGDGHPHVCGDWFVTDTYPDKARMQHLLLCNWRTGEVKHLGEFFHGFAYDGESRCDLHPRFSDDGSRIYFDSVFTGKRHLYYLNLN